MLENKIEDLISPSLQAIGYDVVQVNIIGDVKKILQVLLDKYDNSSVSISDCEKASYQISAVLDVELDELDKYSLEVSSAGIDRPLTKLKNFERFKGRHVKIEVVDKINDQRKFRGVILGLEGENILLKSNIESIDSNSSETIIIEFNNIRKAKLVLADDLLKRASKK